MSRTRFINVAKNEVVTSTARNPERGVVPQFTFLGELDAGVSGKWPVTEPVELVSGTVTALSPGTTDAAFVIMKDFLIIGGARSSTVLRAFKVPAASTHFEFRMDHNPVDPTILNVGDRLFIASFTASGHEAVVFDFVSRRVRH